MYSNRDFIDRIKREVPLETYISRYITLSRRGKRLLGLCPFHKEKTPSFTVSPDLQLFHCFGCQKSGDLFKFVMEYDRVDFNQAKQTLSEYSGIVEAHSPKFQSDSHEKNDFYTLNELVCNYFHNNLKSEQGREAKEYLFKRGITNSEIDYFHLGYALHGFDNLIRTVLKDNSKVQHALKLGLLKENSSKKGQYYDFYRNRIIFPIRDTMNRISGFGARDISGSTTEAKYINSPASVVYDKGKMFYNLNLAANSIRQSRTVIIVEGYLDVIGLTNLEVQNVVAPLGTAITENQIRILKSYADSGILMLDGDNAGRKAAFRTVGLCLKEGFSVKVVILENGIDPFDLSRQKNKLEVNEILSKSLEASQFVMHEILNGINASSIPEQKQKTLQNLFAFVKNLNRDTDKDQYLEMGAKSLGLNPISVKKDYSSESRDNLDSLKANEPVAVAKTQAVANRSGIQRERTILALLILCNDLFEFASVIAELEFEDEHSYILWSYIYGNYVNNEPITIDSIMESELSDETKGVITSEIISLSDQEDNSDVQKVFQSLLVQHKISTLEKQLINLTNKLNTDSNRLTMNEKGEITRKMVVSRKEKQELLESLKKI